MVIRHCEKATKLEKKSHLFWRLLNKVKTSGRFFFLIFVAFSENLNFKFFFEVRFYVKFAFTKFN